MDNNIKHFIEKFIDQIYIKIDHLPQNYKNDELSELKNHMEELSDDLLEDNSPFIVIEKLKEEFRSSEETADQIIANYYQDNHEKEKKLTKTHNYARMAVGPLAVFAVPIFMGTFNLPVMLPWMIVSLIGIILLNKSSNKLDISLLKTIRPFFLSLIFLGCLALVINITIDNDFGSGIIFFLTYGVILSLIYLNIRTLIRKHG